ncbi:MAG: hypothetical protein WAV47_13040 [Blastocatellia bacterium]
MQAKHFNSESRRAELSHPLRINSNILFTIILALLSAAGMLLLIFHVNRSVELRIETAEVWSDYQVKIVKASAEEDPNLKQQYTEEQDLLRRHAEGLRESGGKARRAVKFSGYGAGLLLLGTAAAALGLVANNRYFGYLGLLLGVIGVGFSLTTFL